MNHKLNSGEPFPLENDFSIGVVTYVARFEEFFMPIIKQLTEVFPDKEIVCIINGHPDAGLHIEYLKHVTFFMAQYPNVRYLTYENHQSLSKCFNWLLMMSLAPRMLILNDDLSLNLLFRKDLEKALVQYPDFFIINHSWSHFVISKEVVKKVGWFDQRFLGTGMEDGDYRARMLELGIPVNEVKCHGIINYIAPQTNAGWQNISEISGASGKTSLINDEFFEKKFTKVGLDQEGYPVYKLTSGMETPLFYPLQSLDDAGKYPLPKMDFKNIRINPSLKLLLPFHWFYSLTRKAAGKIYRFIKGIK